MCLRMVVALVTTCALAQDSPPERVEVKGTVVNSITGQPIAGASVVLDRGYDMAKLQTDQNPRPPVGIQRPPGSLGSQRPPRQRDQLSTITDDGGAFSFSTTLGIGWSLSVSHRNFRAPGGAAQDIAHVGGSADFKPTAITVKLDPLGVIEGKVVNEDGEPLPDLPIELFKVEIKDGRRDIRRYARKTTDDLGAYRLWALSPGTYYLKASGAPTQMQSGVSYGPIFYPVSADMAGAKLIRLAPGEDLRADFAVTAHPGFHVRGTFLTPIADRRITIRLLQDDVETAVRFNLAPASNTFDLFDISPGSYTLQAYSAAGTGMLFGETSLVVGNAEVTGVTLALSPAVSLTGTAQQVGNAPATLQVQAIHSSPSRLPAGLPKVPFGIMQNGSLILQNLWPGHYSFTTQTFGAAYVRSITSGSIDVLADGLTIGTTAPEPLRIELGEAAATIMAKLPETVPDASFVNVAVCSRQSDTRVLVSTQIGTFVAPDSQQPMAIVQGLAPGDYLVYAWRDTQQIEFRKPGILAAFSQYAIGVTVAAGDSKEVTLKLIPKEDPRP